MSGIDAVMARIGEIQSQIGALSGTAAGDTVLGTVNPGSSGATGSAANSTTFAKALNTVTSPSAAPATPVSPTLIQPSSPGQLGAQAVTIAKKYLGVPYVWGGTDPAKGLDCSGLVQLVYKQLGINLPRVAADQARAGTAVPNLSQAQPGDLVVFRGGSHIGIYVGNGKMIEAPHTGDVVKISNVAGHGTVTAIRRLGTPAQAPTTGSVDQYRASFTAAETKYNLPTGLLRAIAQVESGGNAHAVSKAGAQGLMQLMPGTARGLGVNPFDPAQAIDGAARLMSSNLKTFGTLDLAIAAYNAGAGAVRQYHGIPPYAETQAYVRKVRAALAGGNA